MSDSNLRELERRLRASGSIEDEATWLVARVHAGDLGQSNLELAARLGHEAAALATGQGPSARGWIVELSESRDDTMTLRLAETIGHSALEKLPDTPLRQRALGLLRSRAGSLDEPVALSLLRRLHAAGDGASSEEHRRLLRLSAKLIEQVWWAHGLPGLHYPQMTRCLDELREELGLDPDQLLSQIALES